MEIPLDDVKDLFRSFSNVALAKKERDAAYKDCSGTWGYYGAVYEDRLDDEMKEFGIVLGRIVSNQVNREIASLRLENNI